MADYLKLRAAEPTVPSSTLEPNLKTNPGLSGKPDEKMRWTHKLGT